MTNICFWDHLDKVSNYSFCERQLCSFVSQPANTWSNIGYLIAAFLIFENFYKKSYGKTSMHFCLLVFLLFIGSTFLHLSSSEIGRRADVLAILLVSAYAVCLNLKLKNSNLNFNYLFSFFSILAAIASYFKNFGSLVLAIQILFIIIQEVKRYKSSDSNFINFKKSCCYFLAAFVCNVLDVTKTICDPENHIISAHGIWHLLVAISVYYLAAYYINLTRGTVSES